MPPEHSARATSSVSPTVPISGVEKTALGDIAMIGRPRLAAEHAVGEGVALADRDRRQVDAVGHVADGPDMLGVVFECSSTTTAPTVFTSTPALVEAEALRCWADGPSRP